MWKKMIAPIVITVLLVVWFAVWSIGCLWLPFSFWGKAAGLLIFGALAGVSIYVLVQRIKEIRSDEEDDLSKY